MLQLQAMSGKEGGVSQSRTVDKTKGRLKVVHYENNHHGDSLLGNLFFSVNCMNAGLRELDST